MQIPGGTWWNDLSAEWKAAFAETFFGHQEEPSPEELEKLFAAPALRFAGPDAPFPNLSFALTDLSGLAALTQLQILVVIFHQVEEISELQSLTALKSLFLYNNRIRSVAPLKDLVQLEQLYLQSNQIDSIQPLEKLTNLKELYVNDNLLASLEGLTEEHGEKLEYFFCKPNPQLKQKEILRVERDLFIRCRGL